MSDTHRQELGEGYLYADDLLVDGKWRKPQLTIAEVLPPFSVKAANGKPIDKWVIGFEGKGKRLVLAKTNQRLVRLVTGQQPGDGWLGKQITLMPREIKAFGGCLCIRVQPPPGMKVPKGVKDQLGDEPQPAGTGSAS